MRMLAKKICIKRPRDENAIYKMSRHKKSVENPNRIDLLFKSIIVMDKDGLNNLDSLNVTIVGEYKYPLFTKILVDVGSPN